MHAASDASVNIERTANLLGALTLELARAQETATAAVVDQSGAAAAALVVIAASPDRTIEHLRRPLGLTQPGATRLVERLVQAGWVERGGSPGRRGLQLTLTESGHAVAARLLAARRAVLTNTLSPLNRTQQGQLSAILETLLASRVGDRADLERLCRLCERPRCDQCPAGRKLDDLLSCGRAESAG
jgi:DNA-binding MarR family transcriptional regulator